MRIALGIALLAAAVTCARGGEGEPLTYKVAGSGQAALEYPRVFLLNQDAVEVFSGSVSANGKATTAVMGSLYFGKEAENGRVLLGKYDAVLGEFTDELGWVDESDTLQRVEPMLVRQAVEAGALKTDVLGRLPTSFTDSNVLSLRVVCKPEAQVEVAREPGGTATPAGYRFTWYYVYDAKSVDGEYYYLIGNQRALVDTPFIRGTDFVSGEARLLGWISVKKVKEWCSNVVLEYNTDLDAVKERYGDGRKKTLPAVMYELASQESEAVAQEPLRDFWASEVGKTQSPLTEQFPLARVSPIGIAPSVPRLHVLEKAEEWFRVATLGSPGNNVSPTTYAKKLQQLEQVTSALRQVDIVFVIDATGSMENEIEAVGGWLKELCDEITSKVATGVPITLNVDRKELSLPSSADVQVSLVAYQDIGANNNASPFNTKVFLSAADLSNDRASIDSAFSQLNLGVLNGGVEAIHDGLKLALGEEAFWRGPQATRLVIVVADEPGDSGKREQQEVLRMMPLPPRVASDRGSKDEDEYRRQHTLLFALYTESEGFEAYKDNLGDLIPSSVVDARVFSIPGFERSTSRRRLFVDQLFEALDFAQKRVERKTAQLKNDLVNEDLGKQPDAIPDSPTAVIMDRLAIEAAMKSAGVTSSKELSELTKVAFTEGYVRLQQEGHSFPTYRMRVSLARGDADELRRTMALLSKGLFRALDPSGSFGDILGTQNPKTIAAKALVLAMREVEGTAAELDGEDELNEAAQRFLAEIQNEPSRSLRTYLGIQAALPMSAEGLLGMPGQELLDLKVVDLEDHALALKRKARCLAYLLNSETAPEDFARVDEHRPAAKDWVYKHPDSGVEFYYVPVTYLP